MHNFNQFLTNPEEIKSWLSKMDIVKYKIHQDLTIDAYQSVNLVHKNLLYLPVQFNETYDFNCSNNPFLSLKGVPFNVKGDFNCGSYVNSLNFLSNLEFAPKTVAGNFVVRFAQLENLIGMPQVKKSITINYAKLKSLKGIQEKVEGAFCCSNNELTTLKYAPHLIENEFNCSFNQLTDLSFSPHVKGHYGCANNQLTSLKGLPLELKSFNCCYNPLTDLNDLKKIKIKTHVYLPKLKILENVSEEFVNTITLKGEDLAILLEKLELEEILNKSTKIKSNKNLKI